MRLVACVAFSATNDVSMDIETGFFLISDITGYTRFLTRSELGHAKEILDAVFESILENVEAPLAVSKVEGDAIFCYVPDRLLRQPQSMLSAMETTYLDFRRQLRLMDINTTCDCNACVNMKELDLKVFIHHGEYIVHEVAGSSELAGADVILVHRLLKNTVADTMGLTGYGLITQTAMDAMGLSGVDEGLTEHVEHFEDFGEVTMYIADLRATWDKEADRQRRIVSRDEAVGYTEVFVPVTPWIAWAYVTDDEVKKRMYSVETHDRTDGGSRLGIGATFHCKHRLGDVDYMVVDMDPPWYFTNENEAGDIATMTTTRIVPVESGVDVQFLMTLADGASNELGPILQNATDISAHALEDIITTDIASGVISQDQIALTDAVRQQAMRPGVATGRFGNLREPAREP